MNAMSEGLVDYRTLFHLMPVPRFLVRPDGLGGYFLISANKKALQYFDRGQKNLLGQKLDEFLDADNSRHFRHSFEVCIKQKKPVSMQSLPGFPGGLRVHGFIINPVVDDDGNVDYMDVIAHADSADHSMLQRERDDAISLLSSIFDVSEVGILVSDETRRVVKVNESFIRMYGWGREELIGMDFADISPLEDRETMQINHDEFIRSGYRSSGEMRIERKDGSVANALFTTATLELSQNRRFQVTTVMDITLRKQMEVSLRLAKEQADMANHAKSTFLANMSHELRTPLNAIIGFSEMMKNETFGVLGNDKYKEYLGDIHLSACHLLEIINEVLDMSKIEAGRVELDESWISVSDLVATVSRMMASRAFTSGLTIVEEVEDGIPPLFADMRLVRQILINLVTNAVKFSNSGQAVIIRARRLKNGSLEFAVIDKGIGIPKDRIQEAMEPFGQISEPVNVKGYQGTGLGLPLAKAMAELHGGSLDLQSELGLGTTVKIIFPPFRTLKKGQNLSTSQDLIGAEGNSNFLKTPVSFNLPVEFMNTIEEKCSKAGLKMTDQRRTILKVISDSEDHPSVEMVYDRARSLNPAISMATVYRTMNLLDELDIVVRHDFRENFSRYEINTDHHDHLIDLESGEVIEFHDDELEALKEKIAARMGFDLVDHRLELYGKKKKRR